MHLLWGPVRLALLIAAMAAAIVAVPATSGAQDEVPQCSDGIDNDGDGAIDGADAGCADGSDDDETDSIYAGIKFITVALPLVSVQGTVAPSGTVKVSKMAIRAQRGSIVNVTCVGKHCPFKVLNRTMLNTTMRLAKLEGKLRPPMVLELRIARPGQLGKFVGYKVRRHKAPARTDACLDQATGAIKGCFG